MATSSVILCLLSVLLSLSQAQDGRCTIANFGDIHGKSIQLPTTQLRPLRARWDLLIPDKCLNAGLVVKACDHDGPPSPTVTILSSHAVTIERNALLRFHHLVVDVTVFCRSLNGTRLMYSPEPLRYSF
ncbi:hypothetical protein evm_012434 [Chilo suppressalis]|nr:hypothetical protein evm_012434 [Chilo suppressalis]